MKRPETCRRTAAYLREYRRFVGDARRRREWLWLRAREKEDDTSLESLARADPELPARMRAIDDELGKITDLRARREAYGRALDQRSPQVPEVDCACASCAAGALS
jgi:hypothetical protein